MWYLNLEWRPSSCTQHWCWRKGSWSTIHVLRLCWSSRGARYDDGATFKIHSLYISLVLKSHHIIQTWVLTNPLQTVDWIYSDICRFFRIKLEIVSSISLLCGLNYSDWWIDIDLHRILHKLLLLNVFFYQRPLYTIIFKHKEYMRWLLVVKWMNIRFFNKLE